MNTNTNDKKSAAEARAAALRDHDRMIVGALQDERRGYVQRGLDDRVAQVDEQIEFYRGRLGEDGVPAEDDEKADSAATDDAANEAGANEAGAKVTPKATKKA